MITRTNMKIADLNTTTLIIQMKWAKHSSQKHFFRGVKTKNQKELHVVYNGCDHTKTQRENTKVEKVCYVNSKTRKAGWLY